ncbi:hypothetical protein ACWEQL_21225 [Kitasatospora sp. NPDC004240]
MQTFVEALRIHVLQPLQASGIDYRLLSGLLTAVFGSGYSVATVQRIGSGKKIPPREVLEHLLDLADEHAGLLDGDARTSVTDAYRPALKHANPTLHRVYELQDELALRTTEAEQLAAQNAQLQADLATERLRFLEWSYDQRTRSWSVVGTWWPGPTTAYLTLETRAQPDADAATEETPPNWFISFDPPDAAANGSITFNTPTSPHIVIPSQRVPWSDHPPEPPDDDLTDSPDPPKTTTDDKTSYGLPLPPDLHEVTGRPESDEPTVYSWPPEIQKEAISARPESDKLIVDPKDPRLWLRTEDIQDATGGPEHGKPGDDTADPADPSEIRGPGPGEPSATPDRPRSHWPWSLPAWITEAGEPEPGELADGTADAPGFPAEEFAHPFGTAQSNEVQEAEQDLQQPEAYSQAATGEHHDEVLSQASVEPPSKENLPGPAGDASATQADAHHLPPRQLPTTDNAAPDIPRSADQLIVLLQKLTADGHDDDAVRTVRCYSDLYPLTDTGRLAYQLHRAGFTDLAMTMATYYAIRTPQEVADMAATLRNSQMERAVLPMIKAFAGTRSVPDIAQLAHRLHGPQSDWYAKILLINLGSRTLAEYADLVESLPQTRPLTRLLLGDRTPAVRAELLGRGNSRAVDALAPPPS